MPADVLSWKFSNNVEYSEVMLQPLDGECMINSEDYKVPDDLFFFVETQGTTKGKAFHVAPTMELSTTSPSSSISRSIVKPIWRTLGMCFLAVSMYAISGSPLEFASYFAWTTRKSIDDTILKLLQSLSQELINICYAFLVHLMSQEQ